MSRPLTLHFTTTRRRAFSRLIDRIAARKSKRRQLSQRHPAADRRGDQNVVELFNLIAIVFFQADEDRKAALAFEHVGRLVAADGNLGDFEHVGNVQSVAGDLVAVQRDLQMLFAGRPARPPDPSTPRTCDMASRICSASLRKRLLVFAKNLDGNLRVDARDQFVVAGLDDLRKVELNAGKAFAR